MKQDTAHAGEGTVQLFVFLAALLGTAVVAGPLLFANWIISAIIGVWQPVTETA